MEEQDLQERGAVVKEFFFHLVQLSEELRRRLGRGLDDPKAPTTSPTPLSSVEVRPPMAYTRANYVDWPRCVNAIVDWAGKFGGESEVPPRMAYLLFSAACYISDTLLDEANFPPRLPKVARMYWKKSPSWRRGFVECHRRIVCQLRKGLVPQPNCTGEEMALYGIFDLAEDLGRDGIDDDKYLALPSNPSDEDFRDVLSSLVEDEDVLMLFDDGDDGYSSDEGGADADILHPRSMATEILGNLGEMVRVVNLHPEEWFLAFREDRMQRHVVSARSSFVLF